MASYQWEYGEALSGLHFTIVYDDVLDKFTVTSLEGSFDLNALWWSDGDDIPDESGPPQLTGKDHSLNMNGSNTVWDNNGNATSKKIKWDGYQKESKPGLGNEGTDKDTFIEQGETVMFDADPDFNTFFDTTVGAGGDVTLGVRATSVNGDDSIKWADEEPCEESDGAQLFLENFDDAYAPAPPPPNGFDVYDLADTNWSGPNVDEAEIVRDGYQNVLTGTDAIGGEQWLDTQRSQGPMDITHDVEDANGGQATITFSVAAQQFGSFETDATATLDFKWNGEIVASIDVSDDLDDQFNTFSKFDVIVDSDVGTNTLQIVDTGPDSFVGFALDYVQVVDHGFLCA